MLFDTSVMTTLWVNKALHCQTAVDKSHRVWFVPSLSIRPLNSTEKVDFCSINRLKPVWSRPWQVLRQYDSVTDCPGQRCRGQCQISFLGFEYFKFLAQRYMKHSALFFQHKKRKKPLRRSSWLTHDLHCLTVWGEQSSVTSLPHSSSFIHCQHTQNPCSVSLKKTPLKSPNKVTMAHW